MLRQRALDFIQDAATARPAQPFMLYLAFISPHDSAASAPRDAKLYRDAEPPQTPATRETDPGDKPSFYRVPPLTAEQRQTIVTGYRQRLRSLASVDDSVEAIVDKLADLGVLDDTYIFFTSDNGFHLGEHQLGVGKSTDFETDIHVPLMVRGPGIRPGGRSDLLISNVDYSPTFADMAAAKPGRPQDGRSILPVLSRSGAAGAAAGPRPWRNLLLVLHDRGKGQILEGAAMTTSPPLPAAEAPARPAVAPTPIDILLDAGESGVFPGVPVVNPPSFIGVRTSRYLLTRFRGTETQFYDLGKDPWELANKASSMPAGLEQALLDRASRLSRCAGDACSRIEEEPLPASP